MQIDEMFQLSTLTQTGGDTWKKGEDCLNSYGSSIGQTKTYSNKYVGTYHLEGAAAVVQAKEVNRGHQIASPDLVLSFPKPSKICKTMVKMFINDSSEITSQIN